MIKSIQNRLLILLLGFTGAFLLIVGINVFFTLQKDRIERFVNEVEHLHVLQLQDINAIHVFFTFEVRNTEYFKRHISPYIERHDDLIQKINHRVTALENNPLSKYSALDSSLQILKSELLSFDKDLQKIIHLIAERGYKDFGMEGKMRTSIHSLEAVPGIPKDLLLSLRRHEKDYIIRGEKKYVYQLDVESKELAKVIEQSKAIQPKEKELAQKLLDNYQTEFKALVDLDDQIGIKNNASLKRSIDQRAKNLEYILENMLQKIEEESRTILSYMQLTYAILTTFLCVLSIFLSFYIAKRATVRLSVLTEAISSFIQNQFQDTRRYTFRESEDEIGQLTKSYLHLKKEIIAYIQDFNEKVEERTSEINEQKQQIESQSQRLISSIQYAQRIQEAVLADEQDFKSAFKNHFVYFKPRDIIGGDFYWVKRFKTHQKDYAILAVGDCTGHGVPGALMSMLGAALLNEVIHHPEVTSASEALDALRKELIASLHQDRNDKKDGMDIGLLIVDYLSYTLEYAGANRPLVQIRNGEMTIHKGDKMPIGKFFSKEVPFTSTKISIEAGDYFYLLTDGIQDQFGGTDNKKFTKKRLRNLLESMGSQPLETQKWMLSEKISEWQGSFPQTDDQLLVCVEI